MLRSGDLRPKRWIGAAAITASLAVTVLVARADAPTATLVAVAAVLSGCSLGAVMVSSSGLQRILVLIPGVLGVASGVGVGLGHAGRGVVDVDALVGLVGLAAGIYLVVRSLAGPRRPRRRTAGYVRLVASVLGIVVLVWALTPAFIATNVPATPREGVPAEFGIDGAGGVTITDPSGVIHAAWYVPPENGRVVLIRHGSGSTSSDVLPHAAALVDLGYGVLAMDARGHGLSGGTAMDFGWYGTADIEAGLGYLDSRPEVEGIALLGLSMGGEEALGALPDPRVVAVIAEGATARTMEDKRWLVEAYGVRGRIQLLIEWVQYAATGALTHAPRPPALADSVGLAAAKPVLLVTGGDVADEGSAAVHLQRFGDSVDIWTVPDTGHIGGLAAGRDVWIGHVGRFLDAAFSDEATA